MTQRKRSKNISGSVPLGDPLSLAKLVLALNSDALPWRRIASDLAHELIKTAADRDALRSGSVAAKLTDEERDSLAAALDEVGSFKIGDASPRQLSKIIHRLVENLRAVSTVPAALQEQDVQADLDKRKSDAD